MFTTDLVVESLRTSPSRLVMIEGILAILIPLSRPLRVPQLNIAYKTIFFIINTTSGHMFTGR